MITDNKLEKEIFRLNAISETLSSKAVSPVGGFNPTIQDVLDALYDVETDNEKGMYFDSPTVLSHVPGSEDLTTTEFNERISQVTMALDKLLLHGLVYFEHLDDEPFYRTTRDARAYIDFTKVS